jgi:hypothetical protein
MYGCSVCQPSLQPLGLLSDRSQAEPALVNPVFALTLTILLDGQVVMTPTVRAPIGDSAVISDDLSKAEAEKIVKGITNIR